VFELTQEMLSLVPWILLVCFGGMVIISLLFKLAGAKAKRKISFSSVLLSITFGPLIEELIFRGPVWGIAHAEFSTTSWITIVISAIIFGLLHGIITDKDKYFKELNGAGIAKMITCAVFGGLVLGWLAVTTNSLAPGMIVHAVFNAFALVLIGVERTLKNL